MIILGLSDLHGKIDAIEKLQKQLKRADVVCLSGDITNFGGRTEVEKIMDLIGRHAACTLAVSGNCDFPEVDAWLDEKDINLHAGVKSIDGIDFLGLGGSLTTPFNTPNEYNDSDFQSFLEQAKAGLQQDRPMVMVSHQPPVNTVCDRLSDGHHVGSPAIYQFIEQYQPMVCFTGHIHEAVGTDRIGKTHIINPGLLEKGHYAFAEIDKDRVIVEVRAY